MTFRPSSSCSPPVAVYGHPARSVQPPEPGNDVHLARLEQAGETPYQPGHDFVLLGERGTPVEGRFAGVDTEGSGFADGSEDIGRMQPVLGRDAPPQQTGAAHRGILFDERHRESKVVGVQPGGITARTSADDDDVVQSVLRVRDLRLVPDGQKRSPGRSTASPQPRVRPPGTLAT